MRLSSFGQLGRLMMISVMVQQKRRNEQHHAGKAADFGR